MNHLLRTALLHSPIFGKRIRPWYEASQRLQQLSPGDFYSPIASEETIDHHARFDVGEKRCIPTDVFLPGIEINCAAQIKLLKTFDTTGVFGKEWIKRYPTNNAFFQPLDASMLHAMISTYRPRKIIEVGSGFSTLAILDSLEANQLDQTELTLIEPHPERLLENVSAKDRQRFELCQRTLAMEDLDRVRTFAPNDLLLIDSSHVYKIGSDVQMLFEAFYPELPTGALMHVHDIFFPFDYPASWLRRGHHYNEAYVLRAFLQFNPAFDILMWNDFVRHLDGSPLPTEVQGDASEVSCSLWLRRTEPVLR